jgi:hypothetical protein
MKRIRSIVRLVARMLIGAVIGVAAVFFYFTIGYVGARDKKLYFIDHWDAFITVLTMGVLIGAIIGIGWAISEKYRNEQTSHTGELP